MSGDNPRIFSTLDHEFSVQHSRDSKAKRPAHLSMGEALVFERLVQRAQRGAAAPNAPIHCSAIVGSPFTICTNMSAC